MLGYDPVSSIWAPVDLWNEGIRLVEQRWELLRIEEVLSGIYKTSNPVNIYTCQLQKRDGKDFLHLRYGLAVGEHCLTHIYLNVLERMFQSVSDRISIRSE